MKSETKEVRENKVATEQKPSVFDCQLNDKQMNPSEHFNSRQAPKISSLDEFFATGMTPKIQKIYEIWLIDESANDTSIQAYLGVSAPMAESEKRELLGCVYAHNHRQALTKWAKR